MNTINALNHTFAIGTLIFISTLFVIIGVYYSRKFKGLTNYLVANRSMGLYSLTSSLVASALGTAFPLFLLIKLGKKYGNSIQKDKL